MTKMSRLSFLFIFALVIFLTCASGTDPGIFEVDREGALLHYSPVSSHPHWLLPVFPNGTDLVVGTGTMLIKEGSNDSLSVTFVGSSPYSTDPLDISALVRCQLGCDARLEAVAFDGNCEVVAPPACVRLIPRFRRLLLCMRTGEFVTNFPPFLKISDAVIEEQLSSGSPYDVTFDC